MNEKITVKEVLDHARDFLKTHNSDIVSYVMLWPFRSIDLLLEKMNAGQSFDEIDTTQLADKSKSEFGFNVITGDFVYGKVSGILSPKSQDYLVFRCLYENKGQFVNYFDLIHQYNKRAQPPLKVHKDKLYTIIRNIKRRFGILPKKKNSNPDLIKSTRGSGYRLVVTQKIPE